MKFRDFYSSFRELPLFNLNDIRKVSPGFHSVQLNDWRSRGYIERFAGRYYFFADRLMDEGLLYMMTNKIYEPSYISLESALERYHIIPESVLGVTSISSRKTRHFQSKWGTLSYQSIKPILMFGYEVIEASEQVKYKMAVVEKAVLDYLYLNSQVKSKEDFESLRWNRNQLSEQMDNQRFNYYLKIFNSKMLALRCRKLQEFLHA